MNKQDIVKAKIDRIIAREGDLNGFRRSKEYFEEILKEFEISNAVQNLTLNGGLWDD